MVSPLRLYNTRTRGVDEVCPQEPGALGIYVCGLTIYDLAHVGHARAMVVFDALVRYLRHRGWSVRFVRNFTDVDDKIIRRAHERGEAWDALAQNYIDAFHEDARALGLMDPDVEPRVTEHIQPILDLIGELVDKGHAYPAEGSVWFDVASWPDYGRLSNQKVDELRSPEEQAGKRSPADFALWKAAKEGEPSWDSPWGPGRPGWHIECSAMAREHLGKTLDIHGGGLDLVFPHHENEVAQSEAAHGCRFAEVWMHNGLLTMTGGEKMGKSLGNATNIRDALQAFPAEALRLYYLHHHYRSPLPWSSEALPEALAQLARLYDAREVAESLQGNEDPDRVAKDLGADAQAVLDLGRAFPDALHHALDNDFNTAQALAHALELARAINRFGNHKKARKRGRPLVQPALDAFDLLARALGLLAMDTASFQEEVKTKRLSALNLSRDDVDAKLQARAQARADKDWATSDALRAELETSGVLVMDTPDGQEWRLKL